MRLFTKRDAFVGEPSSFVPQSQTTLFTFERGERGGQKWAKGATQANIRLSYKHFCADQQDLTVTMLGTGESPLGAPLGATFTF